MVHPMTVEHIGTTVPASHGFAQRRQAILAQLEELHRDEGAAVLDGGSYDRRPIDKLRAELESIDAAEGEAVRREHASRASAAATLRAEQAGKLIAFEQQRLDALDVAEKSARDLCSALEEARFCAGAIQRLAAWLEIRRPVPVLDHDNRISRRLSAALKPLTGVGQKYGHLTFREALPQERGPWREGEADLMREYLPQKTEDTTNGN